MRKIGEYTVRLEEEISHVDKRMGRVYRCIDQAGTPLLIHIMEAGADKEFLSSFYQSESELYVDFEVIIEKSTRLPLHTQI